MPVQQPWKLWSDLDEAEMCAILLTSDCFERPLPAAGLLERLQLAAANRVLPIVLGMTLASCRKHLLQYSPAESDVLYRLQASDVLALPIDASPASTQTVCHAVVQHLAERVSPIWARRFREDSRLVRDSLVLYHNTAKLSLALATLGSPDAFQELSMEQKLTSRRFAEELHRFCEEMFERAVKSSEEESE